MFGSLKCDCDNKNEVYLVASAGCADDAAAVASLPDQWVPRRGGTILSNYLKEREQNHEKTLGDIITGAKAVNSAVDTKVREISENLLALIQQTEKKMECVVEDIHPGDSAVLSVNTRDEALKEIYKLHSQNIDNIASFKREALSLERERADGLRILFRNNFERLVQVGHRTPKDLLHEFDDRAYEVNQQLLSNNRAYTELEAQLRVQADEAVVRARSAINQLCVGVTMSSRGRSALPWAHREQSLQRRSAGTLAEKRRGVSDPSIDQILVKVEEFEECVTRLVNAYKAAVVRVYTDFSGKLNDLEKDLGSQHQIFGYNETRNYQQEFQVMIDKTLRRLSSTIHKKQMSTRDIIEVTSTHISTMQKSLWALGECLQETYKTLHDAGHLWDAHILRQALAQKLTIAAVEDLFTSNDTAEMANEIVFDIALEQLRGSSDPDKLQQQYDVIIAMLNRTAEMYRTHSEAELGRLEEFMNLPSSLAYTLLSEFDCFLEKHPRIINPATRSPGSTSNQPESPQKSPRSLTSVNTLRSPLPRAILQTELQELALRNWRNGFLECFQSNVTLVPEELRRQARIWVDERGAALQMRYSLKMVSHSIRAERVKASREARLAELRSHETRLESHLDAIYDLVDTLPIGASEFASIDSPYLYPLCQWIERMKVDMDALLLKVPLDPEVKRLKMCSYAPRLIKHRQLFEESLNAAVESYKRQSEYRIQNARVANIRFMSLISLFHEGGRYSAQEATRTCNSLVRGADAIEACVSRVTDALNVRRHQLMVQADQLIQPLQRIVDEVLKTGAKGQDKRKPPPPKKK